MDLDDMVGHFRYMKELGIYRDTEVQMNFTHSNLTKFISGKLFDDCEIEFDPEFGTVIITARGYQVIIDLGNTDEWKTPSTCGGHDEALRIIVKDDLELDEDLALKNFTVPVIKKEEVEDHG